MRLLIFNPETEYALASGASFYTPPAMVEALRKGSQLLPEAWAFPDDFILVDDVGEYSSEFQLVDWSMLEDLFRKHIHLAVEPWGWNRALVRKLLDNGVPASSLPTDDEIENIRNLAHRRNTILLNKEWNESVGSSHVVDIPQEFVSEEECLDFLECHPGCWLKAPWSSSGRGVINTAADMSAEQVRQWCHGIIRRQGSVLAETAADRIADFATEWKMDGGVVSYLGLSHFLTSKRGKYISNSKRSQNELTSIFNQLSILNFEEVLNRQKFILEKIFNSYSGPLGVDMMVESSGSIRPFVEVNLRRTMGMLYLSK